YLTLKSTAMLRKIFFSAMGMLCLIVTHAQDSAKTETPASAATTITGSVDVYYRFNFANAKKQLATNNFTSFTNSQNSFELGMASLKVVHSFGKVSAVADIGFGTRAAEFSYNETGILAAVKQAYITYAPSDKVIFTMGKFATHVGYELLDPQLNRNYSMSYMFSYGPFSHTGLKMDVAVSKNFGFMVGVANPTDYLSASFEKKFFLAQLHAASSNGKLTAYLNYVGGKDTAKTTQNQVDWVVIGKLSDKFSIGYNGTVKAITEDGGDSHSWWGQALYLNVDPTSKFGFTIRGEYFDDKKGAAGFGTSFFDATFTLNIKPADHLMIMPEYRADFAKDPYFSKNMDNPTFKKGTGAFILAAVYSF
ncbi:MAG: outer membrane beta-barrel protein, partial [Bacteroidota bacterium]